MVRDENRYGGNTIMTAKNFFTQYILKTYLTFPDNNRKNYVSFIIYTEYRSYGINK